MDDAMTCMLTADELKSLRAGDPWAALLAAILALPQDVERAAVDGEA